MIGYGLQGSPRSPISDWIDQANASSTPILALDVPSGLHTTTGVHSGCCIRAAATLTLAMPKTGLLSQEGRDCLGELYLGDIGVPPALYAADSLGLPATSPFLEGSVIRVLLSETPTRK
jgi:NAD(P)H-hydrate epimerase